VTATTDVIVVDQLIPRSPEQVWPALTTPELVARWWAPGDIAPSRTTGHGGGASGYGPRAGASGQTQSSSVEPITFR
jgi:uncharacterized protein YndB with AHSA1/START domain